jgi:hypothetical protein
LGAATVRVEDGDDSLVQLRRLLELAEGYRAAETAEDARRLGLPNEALWYLEIIDAANAGDVEEGRRRLATLEAVHPHYRDAWRTFAARPDAPPALRDIVGE